MARTLCKRIKDGCLKKDKEKYLSKVNNGTHYCRQCGRIANASKYLCKPEAITQEYIKIAEEKD